MKDTMIITEISCGNTSADVDCETGELLVFADVLYNQSADEMIEILKAYRGMPSKAVKKQVEMGE